MKKYRYVAAFVLVLGLVAVGPAFAGETPAADQVSAAVVESVDVDTQSAETNALEQAELSTPPEDCASEALSSPLQLETRVLSSLSINCSNCTTCDYAGQRCRCGDLGNTCSGTCQAIGPTFTCVHSCAC